MEAWPHQVRAVADVLAARAAGERKVCICCPTGGGKTFIMQTLAEREIEAGGRVVLYTNRKLLTEQISERLMAAGIYHGVRASGYADEREHPVQVSSIPTENARVFKRRQWELHPADLVLVDEAHLQAGKVAAKVIAAHAAAGACVVGFTATPVSLDGLYDRLIVAGTPSELRECGALVPAHHYAPDEPDVAAFKKSRKEAAKLLAKLDAGENLTDREQAALMMTPGVMGRVLEWFLRLNPAMKPTILFAPGVNESIWFAEQLSFPEKRDEGLRHLPAVPAAHIDGEDVWLGGALHKRSRKLCEQLIGTADSPGMIRTGEIKVICNRFIMREGVDIPEIEHMVFATVYGSLASFIQSGGRGLRACPATGKTHLTVQDHGGNFWRHGSLNDDRAWRLDWSSRDYAGNRADRLRGDPERQPRLCPRCKRVLSGRKCSPAFGGCGYEVKPGEKPARPVVQTDGSLKELSGVPFQPRRISQKPDGPQTWEKMYWRSRTVKGARTFRAAMALFAYENGFSWPDPSWPYMPRDVNDYGRLVADVPPAALIPKE